MRDKRKSNPVPVVVMLPDGAPLSPTPKPDKGKVDRSQPKRRD
jgi:hypothetical protein